MSGRSNRNAGKRSYAEESDVSSGKAESGSEEEAPTSRRTKRQRSTKANCVTPTAGEFDEEHSSDDDVAITKKDTPYECGQILRVDVENFMCHRKFTLDLGRNLNFITGRNGSGKSAIAAAIQLCLGSSARHTGRGSNIGKYIREGSDEPAVLQVRLLNEGQDAFKPELYGKRITVKRVITKSSGSTYHLLDQNGKEVTRLKSELESLLKAFNIYVDTPCCILTQEESKRLIHGTAKEKYQFFLKATGLQSVYDDLARVEKDVEESTAMKIQEEPRLEQRKADYKAAYKRVEEFKELDGIEDKIRYQTAMLLWDEVRAEEAVVEGVQAKAAEFEAEVDAAQADLDADSGKNIDAKKIEENVRELDLLREEEQKRAAEAEVKRVEVVQLQRKRDKMDNTLSEQKQGIKEREARIKGNDNEIKLLQDKARNCTDKEGRELMDQITACDAEIARTNQASRDVGESQRELRADMSKLQTEQNRVSGQAVALDRKIGGLRREIQGLESGGNQGRASLFGRSVPQLLDRIRRNSNRFSGPVLGPIGTCITVKEGCENWSPALEKGLQSSLNSFVVSTVQDRNTLFQMMKELNCQSFNPIIMQHNGPRFHTESLNAPNALTMSDALLIKEDLVFNCLIDQMNIDHVALVESENMVLPQFVEHVNGEDRLKYGISRIMTLNATNISYKQGNQSSEMSRGAHRNVLSADTTAYANSLRQDLQEAELELQENQVAQHELARRSNAGNGQLRRLGNELDGISRANKAAMRAKQNLENKLSEVQEAGQIDTTPFEEDTARTRSEIDQIVFKREQLLAEIDTADAQIRACKAEKEIADKAYTDQRAAADQWDKAVTKQLNQQADAKKRRDKLERDLAVKKNNLDKFMVTVQKQIAVRDEKLAAATTGTPQFVNDWDGKPLPLTNKDTKASIDRRIRQFRVDLEEGKKRVNLAGYTMPILNERLDAAQKAYINSKNEFIAISRRLEKAEEDVVKGKRKWEKAYNSNVRETKKSFDYYAQKQGAAGTVKFDYENEEMTLIVQMDSHDSKTKATDVKNLSGGERSYVTLCLLLALGHVTESPFRLLDEYDVFMDEARRNDTLNSIQNHARDKNQRNRQIIVITPNTLASVKHSDFVRIYKMPDPVKRSAHGLQQQTLD